MFMIRWVTPIVVAMLVVFAVISGNALATIAFGVAALAIIVRWLWVVVLGPRPLALELDLTPDELRVRTISRRLELPIRQVRALLPTGFGKRGRGPRALATDVGTFTLFPEAAGFADLVAALRLAVPELDVVERPSDRAGDRDASPSGATDIGSPVATEGAPLTVSDDSGLVPGVVAVRVFGSQTLADLAVKTLAESGITALTLPSSSGLGGIRLTVKEEDRERAERILDA